MHGLTDIMMAAALPVLLVGSAFVSGSETALFSLSRHELARMKRSGTVAGTAVGTLLRETRGLLITLLLANMTLNVSYFVVSTVLLTRLSRGYGLGVGTIAALGVVPLVLLILLGEVVPKLVAARHRWRWSTVSAVLLLIVHRATGPLRIVTETLIVTPLARLIAPPNKPPALSAGELETMLELSRQHEGIDDSEEQMLQQVLELGQLKVKDLMTPRVDMVAHEVMDDPVNLLKKIRMTRHSRIPVYRGDVDHLLGVVHARQVLLAPPETSKQLRQLVRRVTFVPEVQRADRLLVQFRKSGTTMAIAVDEYGGTSGIVTLEDVVEQMVGDIVGPGGPAGEPEVHALGGGRWRVSADLGVHEWVDAMGRVGGLGAAAKRVGISTVGGLVTAKLGRVAREGDRVAVGNVAIVVESMRGTRVGDVTIELIDDGSGEPGGSGSEGRR